MATLSEVISARSLVPPQDAEWLHQLVVDWQMIADLSFGDLILWVPGQAGEWVAVAHVRPTTGPMVFFEDQVGQSADSEREARLDEAAHRQVICRGDRPVMEGDRAVREEVVPVVRGGQTVAALTRHTNLATMRTPGRLELTYLATADALCRMVSTGEFPQRLSPIGGTRGTPRVGDGVIRLDGDGIVMYASPNAVSAIHRLGFVGEMTGSSLAQIVTGLLHDRGPVDEGLAFVLTGRQPWRTEVEQGSAGVSMRSVPLTERGERFGAVVLARDVSEVRRRERELVTKDATIREIHHRVKNNLQSVAALLRLQARRMPDAQGRAALLEAERRVGTIALVHDTLSRGIDESVNFDDIADKAVRAVIDVTRGERTVTWARHGSFGLLRAEDATSIAMVLTELVTNAVEHGLADRGGRVVVDIHREPAQACADGRGQEELTVMITDDGRGLGDEGMAEPGLGTQIVRSLLQDLGGSICWEPSEPQGTRVCFTVRLRPDRR